jgi:hypothetical protein
MARLHLKFRNIKPSTKTAATELFEDGPWTGTDDEKHLKYERFLRKASEAYGIPAPTLEIRMEDGVQRASLSGYEWGRVTLGSWSVTSLFHQFRHHLQAMGCTTTDMHDCDDAQAWACSLFYTVKPRMFRKRVREGRILGVNPDDLLTTATLEARMAELYDGEPPAGLAVDTSSGSHDSLRPDDDDEINRPAAIVDRSAERAAANLPTATDEIDSAGIQEKYGVSRSFVSTHAERMGGWRVGTDPRWHFLALTVHEYMAAREAARA